MDDEQDIFVVTLSERMVFPAAKTKKIGCTQMEQDDDSLSIHRQDKKFSPLAATWCNFLLPPVCLLPASPMEVGALFPFGIRGAGLL